MSDPYEADFVDDADDEADPPEDELEEEDEALEADPAEPDEDDEPPARQPARKPFAQRVEEVAERVAAKRTAALEAELNTLKANQNRPQGETQQQRQARLAEMEPWERTEFLVNERISGMEAATNERLDKQYFDSLCARDPVAAKLKDDVERELSALRARGQNVDRDTMLTFLLGQRARASSGRATGRAQKAATARREQQQARPGNGRGDTPAADRRTANTKAARDKRLEDYQL